MSSTELTTIVRNIKELQQLIDDATVELEGLKDTVKDEMATRKVDELTIDVFKVRWTSVVSNRFDSSGFKSTHADLYKQYTKATEFKRFTIA